jgi:putative oxidoreductase
MYIPQLAQFADFALLGMRLMVALVYGWSGVSTLLKPKRLGLPPTFTIFIGVAEVAGALGIAFGVLTQWAALGLILIMLGAIGTKIFVWKIGFWGEKSSGWNYELIFISMLLVIACLDGGRWVLRP